MAERLVARRACQKHGFEAVGKAGSIARAAGVAARPWSIVSREARCWLVGIDETDLFGSCFAVILAFFLKFFLACGALMRASGRLPHGRGGLPAKIRDPGCTIIPVTAEWESPPREQSVSGKSKMGKLKM